MACAVITPNSQLVIKNVSSFNTRCISTYLPCKYAIQSHGSIYYQQQGTKQADINVKPVDWDTARPFNKMPGPKPLPLVGNLHKFVFGEFKDIHFGEVNRKLREQYGNIVSLRGLFGVTDSIKLFDPEDVEKMFRNEGIWPNRILMPTIDEYKLSIRKEWFRNYPGIISMQGEEWYNIRNKLNPILMQPKAISIYTNPIEAIANDLVGIIGKLSKNSSKNEMPANFDEYIQKYALEASAYVAFNQRIGCLSEDMDELTKQFLNSLNELFKTLQDLDYSPLGLFYKKFNMKPWIESIQRLDCLFTTGKEFIRRAKLLTAEQSVNTNTESGVFEKLMKIDEEFAATFSIELLIAGVETTSKTIGTTLYFLAKNKNVQRRLMQELKDLLPSPDSPITKDILNQMAYLKAVVKESMRISPVSIGLLRITNKDLVLGGYQIPKGTTIEVSNYVIGTNEENYKRPLEFIPERWLKSNECPMEISHKNASPFTALPFGFGSRSCVGKRLALLDVEMFLAKILRNYDVEWLHKDMKFKMNLTLGCADPLQFKMTPVKN